MPDRRVLHLRLDSALLETLDQWRTSQRPILYRNEAVERLLGYALKMTPAQREVYDPADRIKAKLAEPTQDPAHGEFWSTAEAKASGRR